MLQSFNLLIDLTHLVWGEKMGNVSVAGWKQIPQESNKLQD